MRCDGGLLPGVSSFCIDGQMGRVPECQLGGHHCLIPVVHTARCLILGDDGGLWPHSGDMCMSHIHTPVPGASLGRSYRVPFSRVCAPATGRAPEARPSRRRPRLVVLLAITLMALGTPWFAFASLLQTSPISSLTPDEDKWIREHPVVQVGVYAGDHMPMEGWVEGQPQGMGVDYARLLAAYANLRSEFHPFTDWEGAQEGGPSSPNFDLYVAQGVSSQLTPRFQFLRPYVTGSAVIVVRQIESVIRRDSTLEGRRIAVERPLRLFNETVAEHYPAATLMYANDGSEALDMVARGDADAYIGAGVSRTRALLQRRPRDDLRVLGQALVPSSGVAPALPSDRSTLVQILRKAELRVTQDDLVQLRKRWGIDQTVDALPPATTTLTDDQKTWLQSLPELRVGYETDRYPYSFIDDKRQFSGISADYLHMLGDRLGLKFKLVPAADWSAVKAMVANHQIDLIAAGSVNDFPSQDMLFSQPYETFPGVVVARVGGPPITGPSDLSGRVVAIRDEQSMFARATAILGGSKLVPVASNESGLAMVASGKADAYIGTLPAIDSLIRNRYAAELRIIGPASIDLDLAVGLRPSDGALLPYINRELNAVGRVQRQAIRARWLTTDYYYGAPWTWVVVGLGSTLVLFGIGGFAYTKLRRASRAQAMAEKKLGDELSFQQALLETLPYPVFVKDADGRYLAVNVAYEHLVGVARSTIIGRTVLETRHFDHPLPEAQHEADQRVIQTGESERIEIIVPSQPGDDSIHSTISWHRRFVSSSSNEIRMLGTIVDVSDIRSAEARARASEERLSDITEAMPAVVFQLRVWSTGTRHFTYVGGDSKALLDLTPEEVIGNEPELASRLHPDDRIGLLDHVHEAADELKAMTPIDFRLRVRDQWKWLRTEGGHPRRLPDGAAEWSGYWIDTTKAHRQEEELMHAKAQAESAVAAKGAFLAAMSHEIRTPMAGVLGLIELLTRTNVDNEQSSMLSMAQDSAKLLLQILDDILDYSRIEANRIDLESAPFDIHQLVDSVVGVFSGGARSKNISLYAIDDAHLAQAYAGDALRIRQILTNLLSNALKFTDSGSVTVRTLLLQSSQDMHLLKFTVSDTGIGISPAGLARLFHPFTQAEQSTTRRFGGTGLGLSISRRLAEMMGGKLSLKSNAGKGTDAVFELPLPVIQAWTPPEALLGRKATIVTPDTALQEELGSALTALGLTVSSFESAGEVAKGEQSPDLLFANVEEAVDLAASANAHVVAMVSDETHVATELRVLKTGPVLWGPLKDLCLDIFELAEREEERTEAPSTRAASIRILVAEDHPVNQELICRQLDALGYPHTVVNDGQEALTALDKDHFDLVLADCHMPKIDGFELTRRIRQSETEGQHLTIIALSASALPEQVQACLDAGMDGFLAKPVTLGELEAKIASCDKAISGEAARLEAIDGLDARAAHLVSFYKDPVQLRAILSELLALCRADVSELDMATKEEDEARQRFLLHRIEGSLGVIGPIDDGETPLKANASFADRTAFITQRIARLDELLRKLESSAAS